VAGPAQAGQGLALKHAESRGDDGVEAPGHHGELDFTGAVVIQQDEGEDGVGLSEVRVRDWQVSGP